MNHPRDAGAAWKAPGKGWGNLGLASNHVSVSQARESRASYEPSSIPSESRRALTSRYRQAPGSLGTQ